MKSQEDIKLTKKDKRRLKKHRKGGNDRRDVLMVIALGVVALALLVNAISAYNKDPEPSQLVVKVNGADNVAATLPTVTLPPQTTQLPAVSEEEKDTAKPTEPTVKGEITKEEILQRVADGVNSIKSENATYTAVRTQNISLELKECSLPAFVSVVNTVMDFFEGETVTNYSFTNGKGADPKTGEEITAIGCIPPSNNLFTLTMEGLADATMQKDGDNTVYSVVVVPETSTMDNPRPPHHKSAGDTFDCRNVPLPFGAITKADFDYPGATISVTVAPDGKVIRYHQTLIIDGVGEGTAMGMTASGTILGQVDETWDITY